jgi:serine/threonine protein kinase
VLADRWRKVRELYEAALEKSPEERRNFIDRQCAGDDELRKEVDALLNYGERAEHFIESAAFQMAAKSLAADSAMQSLTGREIGHYKIDSFIGAGGMGEVYRATDMRLNRTVAIKVLQPHVANRVEHQQRLQREAKAIAALNHPHICTLHDIGNYEGTDYLVMEYLEGETLADRLLRGPLSIEDVIKYSVQMTDALDKAHQRGLVHRDLKPSNVMLSPSGAKLLDFGLAKLAEPISPDDELPLTAHGTILGTLQYMSPEQLEGKEADVRSDIFALGAVLYEMVTGQKAFRGRSPVSVMAAIMDHTPLPVSSLQPLASPLLDYLIRICLEKSSAKRWQNVADIFTQLNFIAAAGSVVKLQAAERKIRIREVVAWSLLAVLIATGGTVALFRRDSAGSGAVSPTMRFEIVTPKTGFPAHIALSPDNKRIVAVVESEKSSGVLWMRPLDSLDAQILPDTEGAQSPFWSPDGRSVGFFAGGKLKRVGFYGAPSETLCDAPGALGGTWSSDDVILFGSGSGPVFRVPASGGSKAAITQLDPARAETGHLRPAFLPDGKHFLFLALSTRLENSAIFLGSLDSSPPRRLLASELKVAFAPPNHLLFVRESSLMAQAFDPVRFELNGDPTPVVDGIYSNTGNGQAGFTVSENGLLAYRPGGPIANRQLLVRDREGRTRGIGPPAPFQNPKFSPDGQFLALGRRDRGADIWLMNVTSGLLSQFTLDPAVEDDPIWSPDGAFLAFSSTRDGGVANVYMKRFDGSGGEIPILTKSDHPRKPLDWTDRYIVYEDLDPKTGADVWFQPRFGDKAPKPLLRSPASESQAQISPDGRWIAYVSDASGRMEVYVQSFPVVGSSRQISINGGQQPRWGGNGKELFFLSLAASEELMVADIASKAAPRRLFDYDLLTANQRNSYDLMNDQRFLLNVIPRGGGDLAPITVIVNWKPEQH